MPTRRPHALVAALLLLLLPGQAQSQRIADADTFKKSVEAATKAVEIFGASSDEDARERVATLGYRVAQAANFEDALFTFEVVEMAAPNAFALPGGQIFVTRGLLDLGLTDDMLAGILGHEVAHVVQRHGMRMQRRAALLQTLGSVFVVGVLAQAKKEADRAERDNRAPYDPYDPRRGDNSAAQQVEGAIATSVVVSELLLRGYSRDFEREADDEGQRYAAGAGFAPAGLRESMALMESRLPQSKDYGYWQTHPFFEERVRGAEVRAEILTAQPAKDAADYRRRTQEALLKHLDTAASAGQKVEPAVVEWLKSQALLSWPRGERAATLRTERVHAKRDEELGRPELNRDYGALLSLYAREIGDVERLEPEAPVLASLRQERADLASQCAGAYEAAKAVVAGDIFETPFLERFLSNYPNAPEVPRVALALGDAYSRLGASGKAVEMYLKAWQAGPESPEGKRSLAGLKVLAPVVENLAALEQLANHEGDAELARAARQRLDEVSTSYTDLANGADYLRRFPEGSRTSSVANRLNEVAGKLYTEVVLYQGLGDAVRALERINLILTHAPASPAADKLRERAEVRES